MTDLDYDGIIFALVAVYLFPPLANQHRKISKSRINIRVK